MLNDESTDRIRREHLELRALLSELDAAAGGVLAGAPGAIGRIRAAVRALDPIFRAHLVMEESLLVPVLSTQAVLRLRAEHSEQRAALAAIAGEVAADAKEPALIADDVRWLVDGLLRDMGREDRAIDEMSRPLHEVT